MDNHGRVVWVFLSGLAAGGVAGGLLAWMLYGSPAETPGQVNLPAKAEAPALDHSRYMRLAIVEAKKTPKLPFGAVIVDRRTGLVLASGHNRSRESPTFHGEIDVINRLAASAKRPDDWSPLVLYTTAEPCPMCQSAIEWSGIGAVVFGSSIPFLVDQGWSQIDIRAEEVIRRTSFRRTAIVGGVLEEECNALFVAALR
jgi:tRNA(Arg) A34 adenosine deaminase TadA